MTAHDATDAWKAQIETNEYKRKWDELTSPRKVRNSFRGIAVNS